MQVVDVLRQTGGIESMARELDVTGSQAASGAAAMMRVLLVFVLRLLGVFTKAQSYPLIAGWHDLPATRNAAADTSDPN